MAGRDAERSGRVAEKSGHDTAGSRRDAALAGREAAIAGRDAELAAGDAFLAALAKGPATLAYEGEAGIGKTTVWAEILRRAEALQHLVLVARPAKPEQSLSLATLADLLGELEPEAFDGLPDPQRAAIDAVLLGGGSGNRPIQPRLLGTAVRTLLEQLARTRAVVVAIDDMQWTDAVSASVLGFALRRVGTNRIGLLAARRTGEPLPEPLAPALTGHATQVGPMSVAGLHHVIRQELGEAPSRPALVRVHAASGGNPLFALEIVRLLREIGEPPANQPLPVPGDIHELIGQRIRRLAPAVRESLLVAASVAQPHEELVGRVLGREVAADLEAAEAEGLIALDRGRLTFRHPLFGAAIYGYGSAAERRAVHRRLATALAGTEEGARHGALAADGPDAPLAAALEAAAAQATQRGAPTAAAELLDMAIRLTPEADVDDRDRRAVFRGDEMARSGDTARAIAILEDVVATSPLPEYRVRARLKLVSIRYDLDLEPSTLYALCDAALAEPIDDVGLLALAHATTAAAAWPGDGRIKTHANEAMRLLDSMADPDPATLGLAIMAKVGADTDGTNEKPDPRLVERALEAERHAARPEVSERFSGALGVFLKYADDYDGARPWLEQTLQTAIDEGDEAGIPYALSHLPQLELWTGDWPAAEAYAQRHLEVAIDTGLEFQRQTAMYNLAIVHTHQGRVDEARAEIDPDLTTAHVQGNTSGEALLLATRCLLELSLGNLAAAARDGQAATAIRKSMGHTGRRRHDSDVVEALVGLGDLQGAAAVLEDIDEANTVGDLPTHLALAHRSRALVQAARGDTDAALVSLDAAFAEHERALNPFDRGRTFLVLGQVRRRRRERRLAAEALEQALAEFERLGSPLWAAKAREELDRLGRRRGTGDSATLTEMERRVAELAARGLTNKEVAAQLTVSPKTVEAHLARAYEKLGIASRAELGARLTTLAPGSGAAGTAPPAS
ncbi:MAG TPA: LuxR C-terminal-related transcriptional regulator [Candidatus Limnocylindrales bacterium]